MSFDGLRDTRPSRDEEDRGEASFGRGRRSDNCMSGEDEGPSDLATTRDRANSTASNGDGDGNDEDRVNSAVGSLLTLLASTDRRTKSDGSNSRKRKRTRMEGRHDGSLNGAASLPHRSQDVRSGLKQEKGVFSVCGWIVKLAMEWQFVTKKMTLPFGHDMRAGGDIGRV